MAYVVTSGLVDVSHLVAVLGSGEIVDVAPASILLILGEEWLVLAALVPGLAAAFLGWRGLAPRATCSCAGGGLAAARCRGGRERDGPGPSGGSAHRVHGTHPAWLWARRDSVPATA